MTAKPSANTVSAPAPSRSSEGRSTGFGSTLLDTLIPNETLVANAPASPFDVCHAGVVLRTVLFTAGVLGVGALFVAADFPS